MLRLNLKTAILTFLHICYKCDPRGGANRIDEIFILHDSGPDRIIIMGSQATINLLRNIGEWFVDGTSICFTNIFYNKSYRIIFYMEKF
jgi:hypothetical protein